MLCASESWPGNSAWLRESYFTWTVSWLSGSYRKTGTKPFPFDAFFRIDKMVSAFNRLLGAKRLRTMFLAHLANAKAGTKILGELLKAVKPPRVAHFSKVPRI